MNWSRAKNLTIIFLLLLNAFLAVLVYGMSEKNSLTQEQEDAVYKYLSQNKVNLYNTILKDYSPMKQMRILPADFDREKLKEFIFTDSSEVKISFEQDKTIYQLGGKKLIVADNEMVYTSLLQQETLTATRQQALQLCNEMISKSDKIFEGFVLDRIYQKENEYTIEYRLRQNGYFFYDSMLQFTVYGQEITAMKCVNYQLRNMEGNEREILSPDEAIYVFVQNVNYIYGEQETLADAMDIVYCVPDEEADTVWRMAAPCYRFYIFENDHPILINAYTGEVVPDTMF